MEQTFDMSLVINYLEISIVILCFVVGVIIKKYIPAIKNEKIPGIMIAIGIIGNCIYAWNMGNPIDFNVVISGAFSGLSSTGAHQFISKTMGLTSKNNNGNTNTTEDTNTGV